ncbi:hypothetical protein HN51_003235, partial [Arachis hypogaea]
MPHRGGGSCDAGDRRPFSSGDDFQSLVFWITSCVLLIFLNTFFTFRTQPLTISAIYTNPCSSHRKVHGCHSPHRPLQLSWLALLLESWPFQHEGIRHHHHLRQLWCFHWWRRCLLHWCHH